jgi:hypothetical protein
MGVSIMKKKETKLFDKVYELTMYNLDTTMDRIETNKNYIQFKKMGYNLDIVVHFLLDRLVEHLSETNSMELVKDRLNSIVKRVANDKVNKAKYEAKNLKLN